MRRPTKNSLLTYVNKNRSTYQPDAWVVFTKDGDKRKQPKIFASDLSRDNVRWTYAQALNIPIQETRSRRVVNY